MPTTRHPRDFDPAPPDDPAIQLITAVLAGMPRSSLHDILVFLEFWLNLPRHARAVIVKCVRHDLANESVARIAGVKLRTLRGYPQIQALNARLEDYLETKGRQDYTMPELDDSTV